MRLAAGVWWLTMMHWAVALSSAAVSVKDVSSDLSADHEETTDERMAREPVPVSYYPSRRDGPPIKLAQEEGTTLRLPGSGLGGKPTKYHYYPHNQHIYMLPECAIQQVCNAVYVRLNYTQPLCACPPRYREPCSASLNADDLHTTELSADPKGKVMTLAKTCEPVGDMRICRSPRDWSLLALQNIRTGKSHYLVTCRCPPSSQLEGPMTHDQPTYASVPGIRVYGMMCVNNKSVKTAASPTSSSSKRRGRPMRSRRSSYSERSQTSDYDIPFPLDKAMELLPWVLEVQETNGAQ